MSNTRKPKNNAAKNDVAKLELTKTAPVKAVAAKIAAAAPAPAKPVPVQIAPLVRAPAPVMSAKPAATPSTTTPPARVEAPAPKPVSAAPQPPKAGRVSLELVKPGAKHVCVVGSFNGWTPEKTPLVQMGNGRWVGDLAVNPGKHEYLFVVDGQWLPDPNAKESVANPFGGRNSVLRVSAQS